jgi:hypothetical protein
MDFHNNFFIINYSSWVSNRKQLHNQNWISKTIFLIIDNSSWVPYRKQLQGWSMVSSGMLRYVALIRTDVSEEPSVSFVRVTRIGKLGTTLALHSKLVFLHIVLRLLVTASVAPSSPILVTLMKEALSPSETSFPTRATRRNIQQDTILHSHRGENLKSYNCRVNT